MFTSGNKLYDMFQSWLTTNTKGNVKNVMPSFKFAPPPPIPTLSSQSTPPLLVKPPPPNDRILGEGGPILQPTNSNVKVKTGIQKTLNNHQVWFQIGNQTFNLPESEGDEEYKWSSLEHALWVENNLKAAFNKITHRVG